MNKDDIKKALECCITLKADSCKECPYGSTDCNSDKLQRDALDLITEQEKEIERLRTTLRQCNTELNNALESLKSQCREIGELKAENDNLNRDYRNAFERLKSQQREIERLKAENEQLKVKLEKNPLAIKQKIMEEDDYELTEREQATLFLDRMGSDVEILHDIVENLDELLGKGIDEYIKGIDGVEGLKDMWERSAVMEFAEKVKEKYSLYDDKHILYRIIDELLKEYE